MPRTRNNVLAALALMSCLSTLALADASQAQVHPPGGMAAAGRQGPSFQAPRGEFRAQMERRMTERKRIWPPCCGCAPTRWRPWTL